jgi:uncharacterized membrane protein YagU involved in acid resistance
MTPSTPQSIVGIETHGSLTMPRAILYATVVLGLLDATDGVVFFGLQGQNPVQVLQYIASGLLGTRAFTGGLTAAGIGLVLHFAVSLVVAAIYIVASRRIKILRKQWIVAGLLYGAAVWAVMNLILLPLSAVAHDPITVAAWINGIVGHALFVGLPCGFFAWRVQTA